MLISQSRNFVFIHVQKTAGTNLTQWLAPYCLRPNASQLNRIASDLRLIDWRRHHFRIHDPLRRVQAVLPREVYAGMFKFAFVRNPWSRLVSWYEYILRTGNHHRRDQVAGLEGFDAFVDLYTANARRSQWSMLVDRDGKLGVDFVGRLETLDADVTTICTRLGIESTSLPHHNKADAKPWRDYYSPRSIAWVRDRWHREIEAFDYRFDDD
jgi:hypothetical protein